MCLVQMKCLSDTQTASKKEEDVAKDSPQDLNRDRSKSNQLDASGKGGVEILCSYSTQTEEYTSFLILYEFQIVQNDSYSSYGHG